MAASIPLETTPSHEVKPTEPPVAEVSITEHLQNIYRNTLNLHVGCLRCSVSYKRLSRNNLANLVAEVLVLLLLLLIYYDLETL